MEDILLYLIKLINNDLKIVYDKAFDTSYKKRYSKFFESLDVFDN